MGWIPVGVALLAAWLFGFAEHPVLAWTSVGVAVLALWSYGVMHNFAVEAAKERLARLADNMRVEGRSDDDMERVMALRLQVTPDDAQAAPNVLTMINMACALGAVVLLIASWVV